MSSFSINAKVPADGDFLIAGLVEPGPSYWAILRGLLRESQVRGALVMDAHLAALAIENGAVLHSTDRDFRRFEGLQIKNPIQ